MAKRIDLSGQRFGRLVVIERSGRDTSGRNAMWLCRCDCGGTTRASTAHLTSGHSQSCGCLKMEHFIDGGKKTRYKATHGKSRSRIYNIYRGMKERCFNPNDEKYYLYGGRGITVCAEWLNDFQAFYDWAMNNGYADDLTIDRIDGNGNYEPSNCRWATATEQNNNKRNNKLITYNGKTQTVAQWASELNINRITLYSRIRNGWPIEKALQGGNNG